MAITAATQAWSQGEDFVVENFAQEYHYCYSGRYQHIALKAL